MTGAVIQCASGDYTPLLAATVPWHGRYADHHGLIYIPAFGQTKKDRHPNWSRFPLLLETLQAGFADVVIWMDADCVIADPNVNLLEAMNDVLHIGMVLHQQAWPTLGFHYNAGVMYVRRTPRAISFLELVHKTGKMEIQNSPAWENQTTIHALIDSDKFPISRIGNQWNSTPSVNDVLRPVVRSFHGMGATCLPQLTEIADGHFKEAYELPEM